MILCAWQVLPLIFLYAAIRTIRWALQTVSDHLHLRIVHIPLRTHYSSPSPAFCGPSAHSLAPTGAGPVPVAPGTPSKSPASPSRRRGRDLETVLSIESMLISYSYKQPSYTHNPGSISRLFKAESLTNLASSSGLDE